MSLGPALLKKINQKFEPHSTQNLRYKGYDLALVIDEDGHAVQLFLARRKPTEKLKESGMPAP